jgi:hypothetical protein
LRAVALVVDEACRFRRRFAGGYVREEFDGMNWDAAEVFDSVDDVAGSDAYRRYRRTLEAEATGNDELEAADGE